MEQNQYNSQSRRDHQEQDRGDSTESIDSERKSSGTRGPASQAPRATMGAMHEEPFLDQNEKHDKQGGGSLQPVVARELGQDDRDAMRQLGGDGGQMEQRHPRDARGAEETVDQTAHAVESTNRVSGLATSGGAAVTSDLASRYGQVDKRSLLSKSSLAPDNSRKQQETNDGPRDSMQEASHLDIFDGERSTTKWRSKFDQDHHEEGELKIEDKEDYRGQRNGAGHQAAMTQPVEESNRENEHRQRNRVKMEGGNVRTIDVPGQAYQSPLQNEKDGDIQRARQAVSSTMATVVPAPYGASDHSQPAIKQGPGNLAITRNEGTRATPIQLRGGVHVIVQRSHQKSQEQNEKEGPAGGSMGSSGDSRRQDHAGSGHLISPTEKVSLEGSVRGKTLRLISAESMNADSRIAEGTKDAGGVSGPPAQVSRLVEGAPYARYERLPLNSIGAYQTLQRLPNVNSVSILHQNQVAMQHGWAQNQGALRPKVEHNAKKGSFIYASELDDIGSTNHKWSRNDPSGFWTKDPHAASKGHYAAFASRRAASFLAMSHGALEAGEQGDELGGKLSEVVGRNDHRQMRQGKAGLKQHSYFRSGQQRGSLAHFDEGTAPQASQFRVSNKAKAVADLSAGDILLGPDKRLKALEKVGNRMGSESMNAIKLLKEARTTLCRENADLKQEVSKLRRDLAESQAANETLQVRVRKLMTTQQSAQKRQHESPQRAEASPAIQQDSNSISKGNHLPHTKIDLPKMDRGAFLPKLTGEAAADNTAGAPLSVHGRTQAASSPSANSGRESQLVETSQLAELHELMKEQLRDKKEQLVDKSKNLELYRSKLYMGELKHIELQRENQALRHRLNQYRKIVADVQRFQSDQGASVSLSTTDSFPRGHSTSVQFNNGAALNPEGSRIPIQLRTDGLSGEKKRAYESTEAIKNELELIRSLQTQLSSASLPPRIAGGQQLSADDGFQTLAGSSDMFASRDHPGSTEMQVLSSNLVGHSHAEESVAAAYGDQNLSQEKVGLAVEARDTDDDSLQMSGRNQDRHRRNLPVQSASIPEVTGRVRDAQKPAQAAGSPRMASDAPLPEALSREDSLFREPRQESNILQRPGANKPQQPNQPTNQAQPVPPVDQSALQELMDLVRPGGQHPNVGSGPVVQDISAPGSAEKVAESQDVEQNWQVKGLLSARDQLPVLISKILQASGDVGTLFQQMEASLHRIVGPACQKIHCMVLDDELANILAQGRGGSERLLSREMTIGTSSMTLVALRRTGDDPSHRSPLKIHQTTKSPPRKNKGDGRKKQQDDSLNAFVPAFQDLEAAKLQVQVRPKCVIYPVTRAKNNRSSPGSSGPQTVMIIQIDVSTEKLRLGSIQQGAQKMGISQIQKKDTVGKRSSADLPKHNRMKSTTVHQPGSGIFGSGKKGSLEQDNLSLGQANPHAACYGVSLSNKLKYIGSIMTCFVQACDQLALERRAATQGQRLGKILRAIKVILAARRHQDLSAEMQARLPSVYDFEHAGVLFYEDKGACLYSINCTDLRNTVLTDEHIIRLPTNMGVTGRAIAARRALSFPAGQEDPSYRMEVDNIVQIRAIKNVLVCPLIDEKGRLRGALQLINKRGQEDIPAEDAEELETICPALAEVVNLCESLREATSVSAGLASSIEAISDHLQGQGRQFEYQLHMKEVRYHLGQIQSQAKSLAATKREAVLAEGTLVGKIFAELVKQSGGQGKRPLPARAAQLATLSGLQPEK